MVKKSMTYGGTGINYDAMDPYKRAAQKAGRETAGNIEQFPGFFEVEESRGESVYLIEEKDSFRVLVEEGLGSKGIPADEMYKLTGNSYYDQIAQCTVAMIVNDLITSGAMPMAVTQHLAVGSSAWFKDKKRSQDLIDGWKRACMLARCVWACGETPTLRDIIDPKRVVLSGSAIGIIKPKERRIVENIQHGDAIVLVESSGIHANGLTLARDIAAKLPKGYLQELSNGRTYGDTLLDPTHIYVSFVKECIDRGIDIHYAVNITGHGWRKLMRANKPFKYVIEEVPDLLPIFEFIQKSGPVSDYDAYFDLNMSAGFSLYVSILDADKVIDAAKYCGFKAWYAGHIEENHKKEVVILPKDIRYDGSTLKVR